MKVEEFSKSIHFLIVDDDAESRATVMEYLMANGYSRVTLAHDGTDALRLLDRDPSINFVNSDWDMPLMNGFELLQRVRLNPMRAHIPFLVVTSPISEESEKVALAAEHLVSGYMIKPFRSQVLQDKIQKILTVSALGVSRNIVVVDDDSDSRSMVVEYLEAMGFKDIESFADGAQALAYIQKNPAKVGLIVSDWEMPQLTGIELLKACKGQEKLAEIPFLIITSQTSIEKMKVMQAARANVSQYILKPFKGEDFKRRVEEALEKAKFSHEVKKFTALGQDHLEKGRFQTAIFQFEEALKLQPEHEPALSGMGDALTRFRGKQAGITFYKRAIEASPLTSKNYLKLAGAYEQLGWSDRAIALLQTAIQHIGFNVDLHFHLGKLYSKKNLFDQAQQELEMVLEIQPDHREAKILMDMLGLNRKEKK